MSVKVDIERSTKARTEGNASFKKGRWTEAIGHYTTAIVFNSQDGLGYTNRAAAYLKLEKWKDAERDCTSAIALPKGETNVKALYRRGLARKALTDVAGALEDIDAVIAIEPANETAQEELLELEEIQRRAAGLKEEQSKKAKELPPSPPLKPVTTMPPTLDAMQATEKKETPTLKAPADSSVSTKLSTGPKLSFADLKKDRLAAGRKTFAISSSSTEPTPVIEDATSPSALSLDKASITESAASTPSSSDLSDTPIPLLDPTIPGSALALISSIRSRSTKATWPVISDLAKNPERIGKMLDNILEPDQLGLILARLRETIDLDLATKEERRESVKAFIAGLRMTNRWGMTVIMLSIKEKQLGREVWELAGGTGDWTKTT